MKFNFCIALLMQLIVVGVVFAADKDCSDVKCPSVPKHYEELGCEEVKSKDECCAVSYKCPDLEARDKTKCFYKNLVLNNTERLDSSSLEGMCSAGCYCRGGDEPGQRAEFHCAHIDCPEFFGSHTPHDCIRQYTKDSCCSTKTVCGDEVKKLATCEYEEETYSEGQAIYPDGTCYKCICSKTFDNSTELEKNPDCHKIECGIALRNVGRVLEGCVPVYYKVDNCCPIGWKCPEDKQMKIVENAKNVNSTATGAKCKFGQLELNVGDSLKGDVEDKCTKCTCTTPPMVHCIQSC